MDFSNFDPAAAVLLKAEDLNESNVADDEQDERQFVDENPCLLCGHKAFANFIDITLPTSCTSQSSTPVRKKLKDILKKIWVHSKDDNKLCLACNDLVDRYDSLEEQLNNIRENIEEKYQKTCVKKHIKIKAQGTPKRRGRPKVKNDGKSGNKKKRKSENPSEEEKDDDFLNDMDMNYDRGDADSDYSGGENEMTTMDKNSVKEIQTRAQPKPAMQTIQPVEQAQMVPNLNVYDEHHQMLQRGQKMRLGKLFKDENNMDLYKCGYCQHTWANITQLHNHVHSYHMPEVVDVAIPAELGMGNTMNCGIELQNVSEPPGCPKPWSCIFCDAAFRARTNMSSHFKEKHTPYKPFVCADCGDAFRKGIDLNRHKLYFCPKRKVTFGPKRKYKKREPKEKIQNRKKPNGKADSPDTSESV